MNLRFQPDPDDYSNFIDIKAATKVWKDLAVHALQGCVWHARAVPSITGASLQHLQAGGITRARACFFDPARGLGCWGSLPLLAPQGAPLTRPSFDISPLRGPIPLTLVTALTQSHGKPRKPHVRKACA